MRVLNTVIFICALVCIAVPAWAVEITPSNVVLPASSGELFSFDYIVSDAMGTNAMTFQSTISVTGPSTLTFDKTASEAVIANTGYWAYDNSLQAAAVDRGGGIYAFGGGADNPWFETLLNGDIMARYAFTWDGTVGDYTFSLDLDTTQSFIQNNNYLTEPLQFNPGNYPGDSSSFTVTIPEPATLMLLALGSTILLRKRRA